MNLSEERLAEVKDYREKELDYIIKYKKIYAVFQPIISLRNGQVLGYEALSRLKENTVIRDAETLFRLAGEYQRMWDLESLCRKKSLEAANIYLKPPYNKKIFINVNPKVMHDKKFRDGFTREFLEEFHITPENIIFEITERNAIQDIESFKGAIEHYKKQHYQIAIDDAGAGYSGLTLISDIHPHFLKIDMKLIRDIDKDHIKYALVKSLIEFSQITNTDLIAEGIETKEEMKTLVSLGVQYGQGYLIQKPEETIREISPLILHYISTLNKRKNYMRGSKLSSTYISNITTKSKVIPPIMKVEEVFDKFKEEPEIHGMCIVDERKVLGIITREKLTLKLSGRYGFSLNQRKEVAAVMDTEFLSVDYHTPISTVSYLAMGRKSENLYDMVVVLKEGEYYGTVTIKDLLTKSTEIEVANAKDQNPLTGLPGNMEIEYVMKQSIGKSEATSYVYVDIDNFKSFNDVYGFEKGDVVIKTLSKLLLNSVKKDDFVGHVGGDDFILVLNHYNWNEISMKIIQNFENETRLLYEPEDIKRGYIISKNRNGIMEKFPLMSLTIVATTDRNKYECTHKITEELARLKQKGKLQRGNICYGEN